MIDKLIGLGPAMGHCSDDQTKKFILLSTQRSGSSWVIDLLNSHPEIRAMSELFLGYETESGRPRWAGDTNILMWIPYTAKHRQFFHRIARYGLYFKYLNEEVFYPRPGYRAIGFKLMYDQMRQHSMLFAYIKSHRVAIVHLIRRNHLDVVLSEKASHLRKMHHMKTGGEVPPIKLTVDPAELLVALEEKDRNLRKAQHTYAHLGLPYTELYYEDLLKDVSRINDVLDFLIPNIRMVNLSSSLRKLNPIEHRNIITNYPEIRTALSETKFCSLLR